MGTLYGVRRTFDVGSKNVTRVLVEMDALTGKDIQRVAIAPGALRRAETARSAERVFVVAQTEAQGHLLAVFDPDLKPLRVTPALALSKRFSLFGVVATGTAVALINGDARDGAVVPPRVYLFDEMGALLGTRTCPSGSFLNLLDPGVMTDGEWIVVHNLEEEGKASLEFRPCSVHVGGPEVVQRALKAGENFFEYDGKLFVEMKDGSGVKVRVLRGDLTAGVEVDDPRPPILRGIVSSKACPGITGSVIDVFAAWTSVVVTTTVCCGDTSPSGVFVCRRAAE